MNTANAQPASRQYAFMLLLLMSGLYFISFFQRVAVPGTVFNELQMDFAASATAITALSSIYLYVYSGMQLFVGILADRYGGIRIIIASGILLFLGSAIFPFSNQLWTLYLSRALVGLGASAMYLCIIKETDSLFHTRNFSMLLGIFCMIGYGGGLFATKPFRFIVEQAGWRTSFMWISIACLLFLVGVLWMGRNLREKHVSGTGRSVLRKLKHVLTNWKIYPIIICGMINFTIYFSIQATIGPKFIQDFLGMEPASASRYTFVMMSFTMLMILSSGAISRMLGNKRKPFLVFASVLSFAGVALLLCGMTFNLPAWGYMLAYVMLALTSGFFPVTAAFMKELNLNDTTAIAISVQNTASYIAVAVAANCIGMLLDCYKSSAIVTEKALIYPPEAYKVIFMIMLCFSCISVISSFFCRETNGKNISVT